ncbi:MAG: hypothetical protein NVSMB2_16130 [Chloroflexota bacterium]
MLDLARLEMGRRPELEIQAADLVALVREVLAECGHVANAHVLELDTSEAVLQGQWDVRRLARALTNLVTNAINYSPQGGTITVRMERVRGSDDDVVLLSVQDHGIGIPDEDLPHVFERFRRGSNVVDRIPGTGIGLASTRWIIQSHGGDVGVRSTADKGTIFTLRLPVTTPAPDGDHLSRAISERQ